MAPTANGPYPLISSHPTAILSTEEFSHSLPVAHSPSTLVVVAEGISLVSCNLVEKLENGSTI